jgi:hypothetical protein
MSRFACLDVSLKDELSIQVR